MTSLIVEIQQAALDAKLPMESLLRRVKLAAAKLNLSALEEWVDSELNGYSETLPEYRILRGQPAAWNPYNGWIPISGGSPKVMEMISQARVGQAVAGLSDLVRSETSNELHYPLPPRQVSVLNDVLDFQTARIVIKLPRGAIVGILDAVRNRVLDWSIEMERQGVLGEGMTFNTHEREAARMAMNTYNIGSIGNFAGNLGAGNSSENITLKVNDVLEVRALIDQLASGVETLLAGGASQRFANAISDMQREVSNPVPDRRRLAGYATDARAALSGAAGSMLATGALTVLGRISEILAG